jgi:FkbM family methyltransferase
MVKRLVRSLFGKLGLEIRKISRPGQEHLQDKVFRLRTTMKESLEQLASTGYYPDVVIDVGTASGTEPFLQVFPGSYFIFIEPLKEFDGKIEDLLRTYKGKYIRAAAGAKNGKIKINVHPDKVGSSVYNETDGSAADGTPREVDLIRLDDLLDELGTPKKILLKIDVQGAELDVLDGAEHLLAYCDAIVLEVSLFKFLQSAPDFYDIIAYMKRKGFAAYDLVEGHNRPYDLALAQKDIVFVKEEGVFRKTHRWATEEQRRLLKNENN